MPRIKAFQQSHSPRRPGAVEAGGIERRFLYILGYGHLRLTLPLLLPSPGTGQPKQQVNERINPDSSVLSQRHLPTWY